MLNRFWPFAIKPTIQLIRLGYLALYTAKLKVVQKASNYRMTSFMWYVGMRVARSIPLILIVVIINFTLIHLAPGDPVFILEPEASPEFIEETRERLGLNKPLWEQLVLYIIQVLKGDLGRSYRQGEPVLDVIARKVPPSLMLAGCALIVAITFGILLGTLSSKKPYSLLDNLSTSTSLFGYSIPTFWLGQILIIVFSVMLGLFPTGGMQDVRTKLTGFPYILDVLWHLVLPVITLSVYNLAVIARLTRGNMLKVLREDYITMAKAKGCSESIVIYKHALKNALLPVITWIGLAVGYLLFGAIMTEIVFSWPGLGRLLYSSLFARDYPVLMGLFIILSITVIISNLVTDIIYARIDPRIHI